ncbi:MAG TPA: SAM-dependent methyltransferase [Candidatus Didemnitutus sp.]|jgi:SAM-dependent MidA family methyltransferase
MGSSEQFHEIFRREPKTREGVSFARFMELALYHPEVGYYTRHRPRIGREPATDFFTATSLGPIFGELVAAAATELIKPHDPSEFTFVEMGAERHWTAGESTLRGIFDGVRHPFGRYQPVPLDELGEPPRFLSAAKDVGGEARHPTGSVPVSSNSTGPVPVSRTILFSNELFDAQPCHRLVWRDGRWRESGVALRDTRLVEVELDALSFEAAAMEEMLPKSAEAGYRLDLPLASRRLLRSLVEAPWNGLFLAFDYGKSWTTLAADTPQGTLRAYSRHRQNPDVLDASGEQDLTCHICWDWLADDLRSAGFETPVIESQEAFFARRATQFLASAVAAEASRLTARKQAIMQLLHPAHMGHKFQVLSALRT